ncbi:TPA: Ail/Lom family outer membrane beta-barrel protein, partial [Escherichia coli]
NISEQQLNNMMAAVSVALQPLVRVVPMTAVEWADQNYYLPKESSYGEGEWKTLPFQIAIMNCMGNDQVPAQAESGHGAFSVGYAQVHPGGVPALSGTGARAGDLKGINVKYRYEFTDHLGGIVALSYASVKKSDTMKTGENTFHYESLRGRYVSLMAGPVWQLSERVSLYGMAGMAYTRWSDSVQDYRRDEVKPGYSVW